MKGLLPLLVSVGVLYANVIDAIAVIVDNEPITTYEIQKTAHNLHLSPKQALDLLIRQKIEEAQIKKLGVSVDDFELESELERFAASRGLSLAGLRNAIESRGVSWSEYTKSFKKQLLRKKLYDKVAQILRDTIGEEQLREYYNNHKDEFTLAKKALLYKYISPSKELLEKIRQNPLYAPENPALLIKGEEEVDLANLDPKFASLINKTPQGSFTPILPLPNDDRYLLILVKSKKDLETIPFEQAKGYILNKLANEQRARSVKEYFDKLRAAAKVKILRMP